jgi:hypothetical protein
MPAESPATAKPVSLSKFPEGAVPFGANEVRLSVWQWLAVALALVLVAQSIPRLWEKLERFDAGRDYRIPYQLSKDYWLYDRCLRQVTDPGSVVVLGDSVVWGEYVLPDGTLSHFLNLEAGQKSKFINGGVNGLFPLALEGLINHYGKSLRHRKVIVHCNVLWMTSPKADLSSEKEERFNHADLVPQFSPRIPCYKADANTRLTAVVERNVRFLEWINHLQNAYFDQKSILSWTLADDGNDPPHYPNAYKNPFAQITFTIPTEPAVDPERGPKSPRHKPWSTTGEGSTRFEWVALDRSLQWAAFRRLVKLLQSRDNDVLVVLGPFNEHIMTKENRPAFHQLRDGIAEWMSKTHVAFVAPEPLPSPLYADASHPLTEGYQLLANHLFSDATFQRWLTGR